MSEYYIGQKFVGEYPPECAEWCGENNAYIKEIKPVGDQRQFEICEIEPFAPTHEDIRQMRVQYRKTHIDDKTLERNRRIANNTWSEEDEAEYLALDAEVTAYIEENFPYPEES